MIVVQVDDHEISPRLYLFRHMLNTAMLANEARILKELSILLYVLQMQTHYLRRNVGIAYTSKASLKRFIANRIFMRNLYGTIA